MLYLESKLNSLLYFYVMKEKRDIVDILLWIVLIIVLSPVIVVAGFIALVLIVCVIGLVLVIPAMLIIKIMDLIF